MMSSVRRLPQAEPAATWRSANAMEPHGVYTIKQSGRVLYVDATGPFNDELIRRYLVD